jgi:hypothetical protein
VVTAATAVVGLAVTAHADPVPCADGGLCAVGDVGPGGGIVFFVRSVGPLAVHAVIPDPNRPGCESDDECSDTAVDVSLTAPEQAALPFDYYEVAPASAQVTEVWSVGSGGHVFVDVPGATSLAFGAGPSNTAAILATLPTDSPAAHYADGYSNNGLADWFLPSTDELRMVLVAKQTFGSAMGALGTLLPSDQYSTIEVHGLSMTTGTQNGDYKDSTFFRVRPIRGFSATVLPTTTTTSSSTTSSTSTTTTTAPPAFVPAAPTTTAPVPTTVPLVPPPAPVVLPTSLGGGSSAVFIDEDGDAVDVPRPPGAPRSDLAAFVAVAADRSIVVSPTGQVWSTDPDDRHGQLDLPLNHPIVGIQLQFAPSAGPDGPTVSGYWLVGSDGGVFAFGSATFHGSTGSRKLNAPVVGIAATPSGKGYWLLGADGGVFTFGDAKFRGSLGTTRSTQPTVALAATPSGKGYWLVGAGGTVTGFGDAAFHGSGRTGSKIVGAAASSTGGGYWLVAADGTVTGYGDVAGP